MGICAPDRVRRPASTAPPVRDHAEEDAGRQAKRIANEAIGSLPKAEPTRGLRDWPWGRIARTGAGALAALALGLSATLAAGVQLAVPVMNALVRLCTQDSIEGCQFYTLLGDPSLTLQLPHVEPLARKPACFSPVSAPINALREAPNTSGTPRPWNSVARLRISRL